MAALSPPAGPHPPATVLVVGTDEALEREVQEPLTVLGLRVLWAVSMAAVSRHLDEGPIDVALIDLRGPDVAGSRILELVRTRQPDASVLVIPDPGAVQAAISAIAEGAEGGLVDLADTRALEAQVREAAARSLHRRKDREVRRRALAPSLTAALAGDPFLADQLFRMSRLAAIGNLAAGVAHDLNNPLQVIVGWLDKLRSDPVDPDERRQALDRLDQAVTQCTTLIGGMARAAAPRDPVPRPVSIPAVARGVVALLDSSLRKRRIEVSIEEVPGVPPVRAVEDDIFQVLLHLALNARDAMPGGGSILIRISAVGRTVHVEVSDPGTGIAPDLLSRVFEPFFTTKGPVGGGGLGLTATRRTVEGFGGRVTLESTPGQGTTARIVVPVETAPRRAARVVEGPPPRATGRRIMVVDDEEPILDLLKTWLDAQGHLVRTCGSGEEAVEVVTSGQFRPDLLILDLRMPGINGWEALARIRSHHPSLPVVILTGSLDSRPPPGIDTDPLLLGLVRKPVRLVDLDASIARMLGGRGTGGQGPDRRDPGG